MTRWLNVSDWLVLLLTVAAAVLTLAGLLTLAVGVLWALTLVYAVDKRDRTIRSGGR